YHVPVVLQVRGGLDVAAWRRSLDAVAARHAVLRTHVEWTARGPEQVIAPDGAPAWTEEEWTDGAVDVAAVVRAELGRPFDLAAGPLWRVRVGRSGAAEHTVVLVLHHLVIDG